MKTRITAPHLRIYNTLEDDINSQFDSLNTEFDGLVSARIVLTHSRNTFKAHIFVNGRSLHVNASAKADLLSTAIDDVFMKAESQIRKHFDKQSSQRHKKGISEIERYMRDKYYETEVA